MKLHLWLCLLTFLVSAGCNRQDDAFEDSQREEELPLGDISDDAPDDFPE